MKNQHRTEGHSCTDTSSLYGICPIIYLRGVGAWGGDRITALRLSNERTAALARGRAGREGGVPIPSPIPVRPSQERAVAGDDGACRGVACGGESVT